jgi:hypothetical protein
MAKRAAKKKATGKQMDFPLNDANLSQRIRDYLTLHKTAKTKEIVEALGQYGVKAANVGNILYAKSKKKSKPGRKAGKVATSHAKHSTNGASSDPFSAAVIFLRATGGMSEAKAMLDKLAEVAKLC